MNNLVPLVPIDIALVSKFPARVENDAQKLRIFGINVIPWRGNNLRLNGFPQGKLAPAALLVDAEELIRSVDRIRFLSEKLRELSPGTRIIMKADWGRKSELGRACEREGINVVHASIDWNRLAKKVREVVDGDGTPIFVEGRVAPLDTSIHTQSNHPRKWRL